MILLIISVLFSTGFGLQPYQSNIPNGNNVYVDGEHWPGVGHLRSMGGGERNPFGKDFSQAGRQWTKALCELDSDGDGKTNGAELGDPQCIWKKGDIPQFDKGITHPGFENPGAVLSKDTCENFVLPSGAKSSNLIMNNYAVLPVDTSYIKKAFTFPEEGNIVRIDIVVDQPAVVHHIILYKCSKDVSDIYGTPAEGPMPCDDVVYAWAVGGKDYCFPNDLSIYISANDPYLAMEIHYDNPTKSSSYVDSSGLKIHYVPGNTLTPATWLWVGAEIPQISIPKGEKNYLITAECDLSEFVRGNNKAQGQSVKLFASVLHGHKLAKQIWVTLERKNQPGYKADVACNTNYDFDLQEMVPMGTDIEITTNDKLTIHCVYDSSKANATTVGGDATYEEMCIGLFMFYPEIPGVGSVKCLRKVSTPAYTTKKCDNMYDIKTDPGIDESSATKHLLTMAYLVFFASFTMW